MVTDLHQNRYALIDDNIVKHIGTQEEKDNTEEGLLWVPIPEGIHVRVGFHYDKKTKLFTRIRKPIEVEKKELLDKVNSIYSQKMRQLTDGFSEFEIMTFPRQDLEMYIYTKGASQKELDNNLVFLKALANARGVPFDALMGKAVQKSKAFAYASGCITGFRQRFEDNITACDDYRVLDEIEGHVNKWRDN